MRDKIFLIFLFVYPLIVNAEPDYYKTLGVTETSTTGEIKKAYRKLSMKWHPDKNPDENAQQKFAEIAEAYEVLGDAETKKMFDNFGHEGLKQQSAQQHHDPFDIFSQFGFGGHHGRDGQPRAPDLRMPLRLTMRQLFFGEFFEIQYRRQVLCTNIDDCQVNRPDCQGPGLRVITQQLGPGFMVQNQQRDDNCVAPGKAWTKSCTACPKGVTETESVTVNVHVERGMKDAEEVLMEGLSDQLVGHEAGHLIFRIQQLPDDDWERDGDDLWMTMHIALLDSLVGFKRTITHLNGDPLEIDRTEVTHYDEIMTIEGKGMPYNGGASFGDLLIKFKVDFPETITQDDKEKLKTILS